MTYIVSGVALNFTHSF